MRHRAANKESTVASVVGLVNRADLLDIQPAPAHQEANTVEELRFFYRMNIALRTA